MYMKFRNSINPIALDIKTLRTPFLINLVFPFDPSHRRHIDYKIIWHTCGLDYFPPVISLYYTIPVYGIIPSFGLIFWRKGKMKIFP